MTDCPGTQRRRFRMRIDVEQARDPRVVSCKVYGNIVRDALDEDDAPEDILGPTAFAKSILLDLSTSAGIDSVGVGWLIRFHKRCEKANGRLIIHSMPPAIRRSFDLLNMQAIFLLAEDEQSALDLANVDSG